MSNNSDQLFLVEDQDLEDIGNNFQIVKKPILKFQSINCHEEEDHSRNHQEEIKKEKQEQEDDDDDDDDNDGFRTPTSLEHRIPVAKQCPPPPSKPKSKPSLKRKPNIIDFSEQLELLLFPTQHNNPLLLLSHSHQNHKKSRSDQKDYKCSNHCQF